jgi:archaellum biogenesis ATPase FlaH
VINVEKIPQSLKVLAQWVLWRVGVRATGDKPTKLPYDVRDQLAKADDSTTWTAFDAALKRHERGGYEGLGFEFSITDPFCGIDLDGCRNKETGEIAEWARKVIVELDSYAEVSPSETGVKIFICGKSPFERGRKCQVAAPKVCDKEPGIEVYDHGRYFAVTGWRLKGPSEPQERAFQLEQVCKRFFVQPGPVKEVDVADRAKRYVARIPGAVSGQRGHDVTYRVACVLILGFGLRTHEALGVMREWNVACQPPWSDGELWHKIKDADKETGERNYLRFTNPEEWDSVEIPAYSQPQKSKNEPKVTTLLEATERYLERVTSGGVDIIELGIQSVDTALCGGVERGELILLAACPSHGKSAVALQIVHNLTRQQRPCVMVSEEMSAIALGKRTLQFASEVPQEYWFKSKHELEGDVCDHFADRAPCYIVESCRTAEVAAERIRWAVKEKQAQCAVVDYAQLLTSAGKSRYEQVTNTSICLRQLASELNIALIALCQLNREVERRERGFRPTLADIKDSGQFGQDADVIMFLCWPHRLNPKNNANEYQFFFAKNRNRGIVTNVVQCRFLPSRQMFQEQRPQDRENYEPAFDQWSERADIQ